MKGSVLLVSVLAVFALLTAGCELFGLVAVSGNVVNVQAPKDQTEYWKGSTSLEGATITMRSMDEDAKTYEGTVKADGTFNVGYVTPGRYEVTGSNSGWTFVPRIVDVSGFLNTIPPMMAYETIDSNTILIMVEWTNLNYDVDSYVIRDNDEYPDEVMTPVVGFNYSAGTGYYTDAANKVFLDRDITVNTDKSIPRVETVRITGNYQNPEYLRYYIRLFANTTGLTGDTANGVKPAGATVYVMKGTEHYGTFPIAYNTAEQTIGVVVLKLTGTDPVTWDLGSFGGAWVYGGMKSVAWSPVVVDKMW